MSRTKPRTILPPSFLGRTLDECKVGIRPDETTAMAIICSHSALRDLLVRLSVCDCHVGLPGHVQLQVPEHLLRELMEAVE